MNKNVVVVGGAGHVGLPFSIVLNRTGMFNVTVVDTDIQKLDLLAKGIYPYVEDGVKEKDLLGITFSERNYHLETADIIVVTIGTPVDEEGNGRVDGLFHLFEEGIIPRMSKNHYQLIILRSTVKPGTTEILKNKIEKKTGLVEGLDFGLVFAPERVAQGKSLVETVSIPQLIGANHPHTFWKCMRFFSLFNDRESQYMSYKEAEFAKLVTNMHRYVNFALANEFYLLGTEHDVDVHKVIKLSKFQYPRLDGLASPGPNVGGPCLFKDGKFLIENVPYADLINSSFHINEGMPAFI